MRRLLEVDVRKAVAADIMVVDQAELSTRGDGLDEFGGGVDVRATLDVLQSLVGARRSLVAVLSSLLKAVVVKVDRPTSEPSLVLLGSRVAMGGQRCAEKATEQQQ